ncbi:fructose-specific PTS transporter subunit EIIC [Metabacillus fastidiosus]|uniref:PTS fructose transporter subunit IIABC n=1 Tax=Metabacillus fastidiosus TaxID=1458 RepID=UPI002E235678|nr:fructose-specific PTS transporter subunit EIIC [Metabacillus fastidiosus]MED4532756.1 fructose-specific PTS transporter subunit EIIC [Metabacillus fastidiosus]
MRITDLLTKNAIKLQLESNSKINVIHELAELLDDAEKLVDKERFTEAVFEREDQSTTGIGEGIAIPHAKTDAVKSVAIAFGKSEEGIDFESFDHEPSRLFFMIATPEGADDIHLKALSRLSLVLMKSEVREKLIFAKTVEDVLAIIDFYDTEENEQAEKAIVLAVTACPAGIAHTYMAADALKEKALELNIKFKVETNGSIGAENILTKEEIEKAAAIIIAADKQVEMDRFKGKHVLRVGVAEGIRQPEKLLKRAVQQDAPVYTGTVKKIEIVSGFYKHLMNGVSNMLPFVVGGGILIAISFMLGIQDHSPYSVFTEALNTIGGGSVFGLMIPVLAGFIAMSIAERPGLAPGMVGGLMAAQSGAGFLGGLIAGFLAGYIIILLKRCFLRLPQSLEGMKPVLFYPLFSIFLTGMMMFFLVNKPVSLLNMQINEFLNGLGTTNLVILGIILGGMMAIDMGGPINKGAFTFGLAMIEAGHFTPHAAIMAGGIVPPLGVALATTIFRHKFTKSEREAGVGCYIMGFSFITEGVIPFAAKDPVRVLASIITGSAAAGGLAMLFGIGLRAPHGGAFIIPFVEGNPFLYAAAIISGALITAFLLGILKKEVMKSSIS